MVEFECSGGEARAIGASSGVGVHIQIAPPGPGPGEPRAAGGAVVSCTLVRRLRVRLETRVAPAVEEEEGGGGGGV